MLPFSLVLSLTLVTINAINEQLSADLTVFQRPLVEGMEIPLFASVVGIRGHPGEVNIRVQCRSSSEVSNRMFCTVLSIYSRMTRMFYFVTRH